MTSNADLFVFHHVSHSLDVAYGIRVIARSASLIGCLRRSRSLIGRSLPSAPSRPPSVTSLKASISGFRATWPSPIGPSMRLRASISVSPVFLV